MSQPSAALLALGPAELLDGRTWQAIPPGFSGAIIFRGDSRKPDGRPALALKGWPTPISIDHGRDRGRVREVHQYQASLAGVDFVPRLYAWHANGLSSNRFETAVEFHGRVWELADWMPGTPCREAEFPQPLRIAAVECLRDLHGRWASRFGQREAPCPAILRRLALLNDFQAWHSQGVPRQPDPLVATALIRVPGLIVPCFQQLNRWANQQVPNQVCFTDIHREHVLFQNERVVGMIDYGAAKFDSPATDLARLFGESAEVLSAAVEEYGTLPVGLAHTLSSTAPVCNLAAWILRIERDRETIADREAVSRRISGWVERLG